MVHKTEGTPKLSRNQKANKYIDRSIDLLIDELIYW